MMFGSQNRDYDSDQEKAFLENLLNQRVSFFLIFFALVLAAAFFVKSKMFFLAILFLGFIISWVLSLTIFVTARKLGSIEKNLFSKIVRWLVGYFLPFFCSAIITAGFLSGAMGYFDTYLTVDLGKVPSVEQGIKKIGETLGKPDSAALRNNPNFKNIDDVIKEQAKQAAAESGAVNDSLKGKNTQKDKAVKAKPNPNFKSIESILDEKKR